ncbi:MAG TPA: hypothetical protein VKB50_04040 [Vicinamibacterales bacterium]|nr:hypothetical protein [Vicinamibacterales bacterium]
MSETFQCGDHGALITYLYDECAPDERDTIALHLAHCVTCAGEVSGLTSTRQALAQWAPPAADLGLEIRRKVEAELVAPSGAVLAFQRPQETTIERAQPWWKAPLPAWAQAAAAIAIFGAGLSIGFVRDGWRTPNPPQVTAVPASVPAAMASKADLANLENQLRTVMAEIPRAAATPVATPAAAHSDDALLQRVQALIEQSEVRQRIDFTERMVAQQQKFEAQRRVDFDQVSTRVGRMSDEQRQQRQASEALAQVVRSLAQPVSQQRP